METETEILIKLIIEGDQDKIDDYCNSKNDWTKNVDCEMVTEMIKNVENPIAYNFLTCIYRKSEDKNKVLHYAKMSANCNDKIGQYNLGKYYSDMKKYEKALHYYRLSANQDYSKAQNSTGYLYNKGYGVEKNCEKAFYYYQLAAKRNDVYGQFNLGLMYIGGGNNEKAIKYLCLSYLGGYTISKYIINDILFDICNIENYIFALIDKNNLLEEENKCMEMENIELKYRPGNIGYYEARDDFYKIKY